MSDGPQPKPLCYKVEYAHTLIGKKWNSLIIHTLMEKPQRFNYIQSFIPDLSKRMLNERIKELEDCGIIARTVIPDRPIRIEYSLTLKGAELGKALKEVENWAEQWV